MFSSASIGVPQAIWPTSGTWFIDGIFSKLDGKCKMFPSASSQPIMNGQDITENALSVIFKHAAGEVPTVTIEYLADKCMVRTLGELIVKSIIRDVVQLLVSS